MTKHPAHLWARILNSIYDKPQTIEELAKSLGVNKETVRRRIVASRDERLIHIAEYRISKLRTNQPTMVFAFGPGQDAPRITKCELDLMAKKAAQPRHVPRRDPFITAFFGARHDSR